MKKFAKMSLVAALAVTGTVATAQPLAEAIKNVDVSGTVVYRYNDYNADNTNDTSPAAGETNSQNYYKAVMNLKSKVNEDVAANVSVSANNNFGGLDYTSKGDTNVDVQLTKVNFAYTGLKNTTVIVGKQGLPTPWTAASDSDGAEQTGTGILALSTWGPVTIAGGYFNQNNFHETIAVGRSIKVGEITNTSAGNEVGDSITANVFTGAEDIATAGIMANIGPVSLDAWYLGLDDSDNEAYSVDTSTGAVTNATGVDVSFDSFTVGANYNLTLGEVKLGFDARYTNLDFDEKGTSEAMGGKEGETEHELWKVGVKAKMGIFGAAVVYGQTGKDGGFVAVDNTSKVAIENWTTALNGQRDATMIKTNINAQVLPSLNVALNYNDVDSDADDKWDEEEIYTQITYKMSKNFMTYVRLGQNTQSNSAGKERDSDVGRLQVQYTF